jgi:hypothetical protein
MVAFDAPSATSATTESSDDVSPASSGFDAAELDDAGFELGGLGTPGLASSAAGLDELGKKVIVFIKIDPFEVESMQTW